MKVKLSYTKVTYSKKSFVALLIRRVRREIRSYGLDGDLQVFDDNTSLSTLVVKLLEEAKPYAKITLVKKLSKNVVRPCSLEGEVITALPALLEGKKLKKKTGIPLTREILIEEFNILAKLWGLDTIEAVSHPLIDVLIQHDPNAWFGLIKSVKYLEDFRKKTT